MQYEFLKINNNEIFEGPILLTPNLFKDQRGFFYESWNYKVFNKIIDRKIDFVQDNHSKSSKGVLRGLHYQLNPFSQGKLIRCTSGKIFDVIVNLKKNSSQYKKWIGIQLDDLEKKQLWIPEGFAHGFLCLSNLAEVEYKTNQYWNKNYERSIIWNDPDLAIKWPLDFLIKKEIIISDSDKNGISVNKAEADGDIFL